VCFKKEELVQTGSVLAGLVESRYMILLMGMFSTFCGLVYNDFASVPLTLFNSCYENDLTTGEAYLIEAGCVYPIGVDPKW
jgi:V-type H+-transporting ATPase subunit a